MRHSMLVVPAVVAAVALVAAAGAPSSLAADADTASTDVLASSSAPRLTREAARLDPSPEMALRKYWTKSRMASAIPADRGLPPGARSTVMPSTKPAGGVAGAAVAESASARAASDITSAVPWWRRRDTVARSNGKVFFTQADGRASSCSAAVINSEAKNTVFTAGHCVHGGRGGSFHRNWIFVPDYYYNDRPDGTWFARELWSLNGWMNNSDNGYDIGAVVLYNDGLGRRIANVTGSQGIWWNGPRDRFVHHFGYPAEPSPPFDGQRLVYCTGTTWNRGWFGTGDLGLNCNMQGGASGGPWVKDFNGGWGYTISVNSYHVGDDLTKIYGPYFGDGAKKLYDAVRYKF